MKRLSILLIVAALAVSCSTADDDRPVYAPSRRPAAVRAADVGALDMLPPADWWRQPMLADAVKVRPDQVAALEKISQDQGNDVLRIESDMTIAVRDLRTQLDATQASSPDIITAGQRIRALRDSMFDRQLNLLASERTVLSVDQWHTLQQQLQERRRQRDNDYGPRRGGRGMGGGRGRWPGY